MADKPTDNLEKAKENSFKEAPTPVNKTTLIAVAVFVVIVIIGIFMIGKFFLYNSKQDGQKAIPVEGNVGP